MKSRDVRLIDFHCSDYGKSITNQELYWDIEKSVLPELGEDSRELYQKLLLENPARARNVTHDIASIAKITDREKRLALYEKSIRVLMVDAVSGLFKKANVTPDDIDFIVVTSSVGKTMPSAASLIANQFGFASKTVTLNLGDMACSSGLAAMDAGMRFLQSEKVPRRCLVVSLEAVTNLFNQSKFGVVPNVVFGEGAAAVLLSTHKEIAKYSLKKSVRTITTQQEAYDVIRFTENEKGPSIRLSRELPEIAAGAIEDNLNQFVPRIISVWDKLKYLLTKKIPNWQRHLNFWALHPGGTAVLDGLAKNLGLAKGHLSFSFRVFEKRSNMSSPSIFYVLREIERQGPPKGSKVLMMTFGSGFKVNTMLMKRVRSGVVEDFTSVDIKAENGEILTQISQQAQGVREGPSTIHASLAAFDPDALASGIWRRSLGANRIKVRSSVVEVLSAEQYFSLVKNLRNLLMPNGQLIEDKLDIDRSTDELNRGVVQQGQFNEVKQAT